jgi:hypothetical protein
MKRVWGHMLAAATLLSGSAVVFSGCVHDDSTLFIRNVIAPPAGGATSGACLYPADPTQPGLSSGVLDSALHSTYDAFFLVGNQMVPEVNQDQLQTETSIITLQGAVVRITDAQGGALRDYTTLTSQSISPSSGSTPGYSSVGLTIVDFDTVTSATIEPDLRTHPLGSASTRVVTYVKFFGVTLGGKSVESDEFVFPVDICYGCLLEYTNSSMGQAFPNCAGAASTSTTPTTPCVLGQDEPVPCILVCDGIPECASNSM